MWIKGFKKVIALNSDDVRVEKAYIKEEDGLTKIIIGNLQIDLVTGTDEAGPLGWKDGQDPGVIFWKTDYFKEAGDHIEFGTGKPIVFENLMESYAERLRELVAEGDTESTG